MFYGLLAISLGEDGLVYIISAAIAGIVWLVRLEGSSKNTNKAVEEMKCEIKEIRAEYKGLREDYRDLKEVFNLSVKEAEHLREEVIEIKGYSKTIIEVLTK